MKSSKSLFIKANWQHSNFSTNFPSIYIHFRYMTFYKKNVAIKEKHLGCQFEEEMLIKLGLK